MNTKSVWNTSTSVNSYILLIHGILQNCVMWGTFEVYILHILDVDMENKFEIDHIL